MSAEVNDQNSERETERRMDAALRRALSTPSQPHKSSGKPNPSPKPKARKRVAKRSGS